MHLSPGSRLGPYEILAILGVGGMGEVYRARDSRLDREVAIKTLSSDRVADTERKRRFIHEAKAASALNHPNIVTIFDIGVDQGIDYLAMELIPGQSIDRLTAQGPLPVPELLRYAIQIADALSKAHSAGIVHRDLKPANVMVTPDGLVKVLDFGLAKLTQKPEAEAAPEGTRTLALTNEGTIVGTAAYMSPEQAEGKPVDTRSDLFSFGAMLYEMATGQKAFKGDSHMSTLFAVMREEPPAATEARPNLPAELGRIIGRCLRKDPARRFQSAADLKVALEDLRDEVAANKASSSASVITPAPDIHPQPIPTPIASSTGSGQTSVPSGPSATMVMQAPKSRMPLMAAGIAVLVAVAGFGGFYASRSSAPASAPVGEMSLPAPLTSDAGLQQMASFSPDGNQVAFDWDGPNRDNFDIYLKLIGPGSPLRLTMDPGLDFGPQWSPDGRTIAFVRMPANDANEMRIITIPSLGGPERTIGVFPLVRFNGGTVGALAWTPDSKWLLVAASTKVGEAVRILRISLETGAQEPVTSPASTDFDTGQAISPDGARLAFRRFGGSRKVFVLNLKRDFLADGEPTEVPIGENSSPGRLVWAADGKSIIYANGSSSASSRLIQFPLPAGPPEAIRDAGLGVSQPALSARAHRLAYTRITSDTNIWAIPLGPKAPAGGALLQRIPSSAREAAPRYSPDGKKLAFHSNRSGSVQIWTCNVDGTGCAQVTSMKGAIQGTPRWSPDGRKLAFDSTTGGGTQIYTMDADGGATKPITTGDSSNVIANWSRDGRWVYFSSNRTGRFEIWKVPAAGGDPIQITHNGGQAPEESADGTTLYFDKDDGRGGIWKMPVSGGPETQVVTTAIHRYNFAVTSKGIYYTLERNAKDGSSAVMFQDFATGKSTQIIKIQKVVDLGLAVSPDESELLYAQIDFEGSNLMLLENFR